MIRTPKTLISALVLGAATLPAFAQAEAPRNDLLTLSATATTEVSHDLLVLSFSTNKEGKDAATVQTQLKQALDAALAEARKVARPGQVDLQAGGLSVFPTYGQAKAANGVTRSVITGWQGSVQLTVQGKDMEAISRLAGQIQSLSIANVAYDLSREAREKVEAEIAGQAIANYKAKAASYAQQFGYRGYQIADVAVSGEGGMQVSYERAPRMKAMAMAADAPLPLEAGKAVVTMTVSGKVQMTR